MVERFRQVGDQLLAVLSRGHLITSPVGTLARRRLVPEVEGILAVAAMRA